MIIDKEEFKRLLNYTKTENDQLIESLIPIVQADLCEYLNNYFHDDYIAYDMGQCAFVSGSRDTITDGQSLFVKKRFAAGMDIHVESWTPNDGIHELYSVAAGTLTLTSNLELVSMSYADTDYGLGLVRISKINWPKALKVVAARMVRHLMNRTDPDGALSENIDGVVMSYDRRIAYPREIMEMANKYRRPEFV